MMKTCLVMRKIYKLRIWELTMMKKSRYETVIAIQVVPSIVGKSEMLRQQRDLNRKSRLKNNRS